MATDWNVWGTIKQATALWLRKDGYAFKIVPSGSTLTADRTINVPNTNADTTLATIDGAQTLTNKAIDGGTASANNKLKLPEDTYANLVSLAGKTEGQIFYANDVDKVYYYNGTTLVEVGSGSGTGRKNYILNPSAATDTSKWTAANITATKDTSTSIPRETTTGTAFKLVSSAGSSTATFLSDAILLDDADLSKKLGIELAINVADSSNWSIDVLASATSGGSYTRLPLSTDVSSVTYLPATVGVFKSTVDMVAATPYIKFRITSVATSKTAYFSDITVTPDGSVVQGAVVSKGITYIPTIGNLGNTNYTATGRYQQVGNFAEVQAEFTKTVNDGSGSGKLTIGLPVGLTIDLSLYSVNASLGVAIWYEDGTNIYEVENVMLSYSTSEIWLVDSGTGNAIVGSQILNGNIVRASFRVPIAEWAGSGTVNLAQNDEEYASNFSTSVSGTNISSFAYGPSGSALPASTASGVFYKDVRFQTPIQPSDSFVLEVNFGDSRWFELSGAEVQSGLQELQYQNTTTYGLGYICTYVDANTIRVAFGQYAALAAATYGGAGSNWSATTGAWKWRVRKTSGGKAVGFSHVVPGVSAGLVPAAGLPGRTDGAAVAAGYVGTTALSTASARNGTGGYANADRSGAAVTASAAEVAYLTLDKGNYLITFSTNCNHSDGADRRFVATLRLGGTAVTINLNTVLASGIIGGICHTVPVHITANATKVSVYAQIISLSGSSANSEHEISAIRIA